MSEIGNPETEQAVLGCILLVPRHLDSVRGEVKPEMFAHHGYREIYSAMLALGERGWETDLLALRNQLQDSGRLEAAGGMTALAGLMQSVPSGGHVEYYTRNLIEAYRKREIKRELATALNSSNGHNASDIASAAIRSLEKIMEGGHRQPKSLAEIGAESQNRDFPPRIATGYRALDDLLCGGFGEGRFIIIAAATSIGKSQFAINLCANMTKNGRPVRCLYICQEMMPEEILVRFIALFGNVKNQSVEVILQKRANQNTHDVHGVGYNAGYAEAEKCLVLVEAEGRVTGSQVRSMCAQKYLWPDGVTSRPEAVFLDYLQQCENDGEESVREMINNVCLVGKSTARRYRIPFIALSQIQRLASAGKPSLHNLKESGNIEQDADTVLLLFRPKKEGAVEEDLEINAAKNRGGPLGSFRLRYAMTTGRITNHPWDLKQGEW